MLHVSELGEHADRFPKDKDGNVPEHHDHWSKMNFDHGENDPDQEGISKEEKDRRTAFLDDQWWPNIIAQSKREKEALAKLPGGNPIKKWRDEVIEEPPNPAGSSIVVE